MYWLAINGEQSELPSVPPFIWLNKFVQSEAMVAYVLDPSGDCAAVLYTHSCPDIYGHLCEKPKMSPQGAKSKLLKTSWWGHISSFWQALSLIPSVSLCLCLCHFPISWLSVSVSTCLCFIFLTSSSRSVSPSRISMISLFVLFLLVSFDVPAQTLTQHDSAVIHQNHVYSQSWWPPSF